jgi:hypothetical protein
MRNNTSKINNTLGKIQETSSIGVGRGVELFPENSHS